MDDEKNIISHPTFNPVSKSLSKIIEMLTPLEERHETAQRVSKDLFKGFVTFNDDELFTKKKTLCDNCNENMFCADCAFELNDIKDNITFKQILEIIYYHIIHQINKKIGEIKTNKTGIQKSEIINITNAVAEDVFNNKLFLVESKESLIHVHKIIIRIYNMMEPSNFNFVPHGCHDMILHFVFDTYFKLAKKYGLMPQEGGSRKLYIDEMYFNMYGGERYYKDIKKIINDCNYDTSVINVKIKEYLDKFNKQKEKNNAIVNSVVISLVKQHGGGVYNKNDYEDLRKEVMFNMFGGL